MKYFFRKIILSSVIILLLNFIEINADTNNYFYLDEIRKNVTETMDVSELKPGMKGFGISVFEGVNPEAFGVEIIGVTKNTDGPKADLIVAKFSGRIIDKAGVIAGMSGSPVYINNKVVGAVSHAFGWSKDAVGMIRPINEMVKLFDGANFEPKKDNKPVFIPLETSLRIEKEKDNPNIFERYKPKTVLASVDTSKNASFVPIKNPILISGMDNRIYNILSKEMEQYGWLPILHGSGSRISNTVGISKELLPGDAAGITIVTGDINAAAVGTVTYRRDNKIVMFGHPAFFKGLVDWELTKEYIHCVIPRYDLSFKMSSTVFPVGRVIDDRYCGVVGVLNETSPNIPVQVSLKNGDKKALYHFNIIQDNVFFPNFLTSSLQQSIYNFTSEAEENTIQFKVQVNVRNLSTNKIDTIQLTDFVTGGTTAENLYVALYRLVAPIEYLLYNEFVNVRIEEVEATFEIEPKWIACKVDKIKILQNPVKVGDELPLLITLKTFKGDYHYKKVSIRIPKNIRSDQILVGVCSAKAETVVQQLLGNEKTAPKSYDNLIRALNRNDRYNDLAVWIDYPNGGVLVDGYEQSNLPSSMITLFGGSRESGSRVINGRIRKYYRSDYFIYGIQLIAVDVIQ